MAHRVKKFNSRPLRDALIIGTLVYVLSVLLVSYSYGAERQVNSPMEAMPAAGPQIHPAPQPQHPQPPRVEPSLPMMGMPPSRSDGLGRQPPGRTPPASPGMISLNFDDADVFSVTQTVFGDIMRVNYVVDPRIKGRVTFRSVTPISRDQVLLVMEVILRLNGIGVVEDQGLYRIVPLSDVAREPSPISFGSDPSKIPATGKSIIQVVPIAYLQSTDVVKLITPFLSATAVVLDVPKSNQVIIVDTDASVKRILQLIQTFDSEAQKKKRAQVFVYPVQNGKARDIANLLQQIFLGSKPSTGQTPASTRQTASSSPSSPSQGAAPPPMAPKQPVQSTKEMGPDTLVSEITRIYADEVINSVICLATPEDYETIKEAIARIDIQPRQVVIEGVVASVNLSDSLSLGLSYSLHGHISFNSGESLKGNFGVNPETLATLDPTSLPGPGFSFVGTDDRGVVRAYVNALASDSKAKLLAAPHVLVSDNREARIQVGQQVPLVTSETFGSATVAPQRTIQYKDIGIILKVKPQVNDSGLVSMDISQEVSTFETIDLFANEKQIILNKAEASTNLVVQNGQTIIIGGLIREDTMGSRTGVPFLSKIPLLGVLFGNRSREVRRQEIIILLTPHVIKSQKDAKDITNRYMNNITDADTVKGGLKKDELLRGGVQIRKGVD